MLPDTESEFIHKLLKLSEGDMILAFLLLSSLLLSAHTLNEDCLTRHALYQAQV